MDTMHYTLQCTYCGKTYQDSPRGFLLTCPEPHPPALLRAQYQQTAFTIHPEFAGIFRFSDWLPIRRVLPSAPGPAVFQSAQLGPRLGLENLIIAFNGYWPEKGAEMTTGSFKELEAPPVCARIADQEAGRLVVSSAGNTGRAFLQVCSTFAIPLTVVVPEVGLPSLWLTQPPNACVKIIALTGAVDYSDAIQLGNWLAEQPDYFPEGGAKNVSRRDGLGTVVLAAVEKLGRLPDHYFQAVGSGTGGIAAWEMSRRLLTDGRFGAKPMQLHLAQNAPFTPMVDAWQQGSRALLPATEDEQRARIRQTHAQVLSNRQPPYSIIGGLYDALCDAGGAMYAVTNQEAEQAGVLFQQTEGCDLDPAAEVAIAALIQAVAQGKVGCKDVIVLNLTGGGYARLRQEKKLRQLQPARVITVNQFRAGHLEDVLM
jgi:cysteate synthase